MKKDKITIKDIARDCGVGLGTVSRVVNDQPGVKDEVRRKVRQYIEDVGWRAHGLRGRFKLDAVDKTVAVIASTSLLERKYDADPLRVLLEQLAGESYTPFALFGSVRENLERVADSSPHGVVLFGGREIHNPALANLRKRGIACINVGDAEGLDAPAVDNAHGKATGRLTRAMVRKGHVRIGFFGGMGMHRKIKNIDDVPLPKIREMLKGVAEAVDGFDPSKSAISDSFDDLSALKKVLKKEVHTAWLCSDEKSCRQFLHCAAECGIRVPEDVSLAALTPDLPFYSFGADVTRMFPDNAAVAGAVVEMLKKFPKKKSVVKSVNYRSYAGGTVARIGES